MNLVSCTRSLICIKSKSTSTKLLICSSLLRVLSTDGLYSCKVIPQLVNSRYIDLAISSHLMPWSPLESISLLWNLQSITISGYYLTDEAIKLPAEIWEMPQLRHLKTVSIDFCLPDPRSTDNQNNVLKNLQTLYTTRNLKCTDEVVGRIPNLKKLGITFRWESRWDDSEVYNLTPLRNLETFYLDGEFDVGKNVCFPRSLKKLTLTGCNMSWEDLTVVGAMPQLEVLNLLYDAVIGVEWNPVEGQFLELKSLIIIKTNLQKWIADSSHFPSLEKLQLEFVKCLEEIPLGIGEIPTLGSISVALCSESVNSSAMKIQEDQQNLGNSDLQVVVKRPMARPLVRTRHLSDHRINIRLDI
ncbi:putative late blight resistance protein homolog R1B-16 [Henckelia pumila]|uniref:putative late blight resistance protein homolog R1B-16 n=1 Tax=Henckelia pumila TaxID=405737 RepID=UPI003C6E3136